VVVSISLLGPFRVHDGDRQMSADAWQRRDASSLVKLLALRRGRQLHREQLMDLLWPDLGVAEATPRLHKAAHFARKAMGRADAVVLRGEMVFLLPAVRVTVDVHEFEAAAEGALADGSPTAAAGVLDSFHGDPLPADLYAAWASEPRERLAGLRHRLSRQARRWREMVELDPLDEEANVERMRELAQGGDRRGALRQFDSLDRALRRELGVGPGPAVTRFRAELMGDLRATGAMTAAEEGQLEQQIRFCRTDDGVTLAYASSGTGPPLVKAANWLTHVDHDWRSPVWRHWLLDLSRRHRLIRYDERGSGLSDWNIEPPTFDSWVRDLETVVDAAGLDRFPLLGISQGGPVAVTYAARHPDRVTKLVIYGGYVQGRMARAASDEAAREHLLQVELASLGWGRDDPAFRQVFTSQFMPKASRELWDQFNELQRNTTSAGNAARILDLSGLIDVTDQAPLVRVPTLVLHARDDQRPPFEQGRLLASLIPDSRFVALESSNHILLADEPAWPVFLREVESFLAE
jgi:pimeloyl-ACP methyl ester carboxylesterase/DNA-binding SARP family transcriptional activator